MLGWMVVYGIGVALIFKRNTAKGGVQIYEGHL
jgi:hypothetical protein